jgi:spore germination protein GerM
MIRTRIAVLAALALTVAACGGAETTDTTMPATTTSSDVTTTSDSSTTTTIAGMTVEVFFGTGDGTDCASVARHERQVVGTSGTPIVSTVQALMAGPTEEERAGGAFSFFGPETADLRVDATLVDGSLTVDFADFSTIIPNASTSCGSANLLAELTTTVFQFPEVDSVSYTFDGSCDAFGEFLQMGCVTIDRSAWPPTTTTAPDDDSIYDSSMPLEPLPGSDGATGSGCAPRGDDLPDGVWFGAMEAVSDVDIGFDLACWFSGDAANEAAAQDGSEEIPVPNDYYVRNEVDTLRTVPVDPDAVIHWYPAGGNLELSVIPWGEWVGDPEGFIDCPGDWCIAWLYVNDGVVTEVVQQYTP